MFLWANLPNQVEKSTGQRPSGESQRARFPGQPVPGLGRSGGFGGGSNPTKTFIGSSYMSESVVVMD